MVSNALHEDAGIGSLSSDALRELVESAFVLDAESGGNLFQGEQSEFTSAGAATVFDAVMNELLTRGEAAVPIRRLPRHKTIH